MQGRQSRSCQNIRQAEGTHAVKGFTLIELMFVVVIIVITTVLAIPLVNNVTSYFRLRGSIASVTGAIQSTRYQAIFQGCPYQLVMNAAASTYQVQNQCPAGGAWANVCVPGVASCPVPLSGSGNPVALNADLTLVFSPGGKVTSASFPGGGINLVLTYGGKPPETISISSYGSINVNP